VPARRAPRPGGKLLAIVIAAVAVALLAPAGAPAELYVVNEKGDVGDAETNKVCDAVAGGTPQCSLRAAIEESNASTTEDDSIKFDSGFKGDPSDDKILLGVNPLEITDKVNIFAEGDQPGLRCQPITGILGPCVQIERATPTNAGLIVAADEVEIKSLAIVGMMTGINVVNEALDFRLEDSWIGLLLNGEPGSNNTGIRLAPGTEGGVIGGPNEGNGNVLGNNGTGLDLEGASSMSVTGNYFGVGPGGGVEPGVEPGANNFTDLEITDYNGAPAEDNSVGTDVGAGSAGPPCDAGCNVFGSKNVLFNLVNIDLKGDGVLEEPASGPTAIQGNYIGLAADGTALEQAEMGEAGIRVGGADEVLIGGPEPGQENHINGGSYGVLAGPTFPGPSPDDLVVQGNSIGVSGDGTETISPPTQSGIFDSSEGVLEADRAEITENTVLMAGGVGIEQHGPGALIAENLIAAATTGIKLWGPESAFGSTVEGNAIENSFANGVLIENDENLLLDNEILGSGAAGIRVQDFLTLISTGNTIGNDLEGDENTISESQGDAIEVAGDEDDETVVGRNNGAANTGLFIDLGADGPGNQAEGPNDGIQAPTISSAATSGASGGGARPGATVRVFRKASSAAGEIESFLGQATADGAGNWSVAYPSAIAGGINIGATQTEASGTSELALATTSAPTPEGGGGTGGGGTGGGPGGAKNKGKGKGKGTGQDRTPPDTRITKGPRGRTHKRTVKFKFVSTEAGSTFQCKLDRKPFKTCRSPKKYKRLKPRKHVFKVRAIDPAGNVDPTPAVRRFKVLK
jgi:Right handed beta helix region